MIKQTHVMLLFKAKMSQCPSNIANDGPTRGAHNSQCPSNIANGGPTKGAHNRAGNQDVKSCGASWCSWSMDHIDNPPKKIGMIRHMAL